MVRNDVVVAGLVKVSGGWHVCPGCGLEAMGKDPFDSYLVRDWCIALFKSMTDLGWTGWTRVLAEKVADAYIKESWHDK